MNHQTFEERENRKRKGIKERKTRRKRERSIKEPHDDLPAHNSKRQEELIKVNKLEPASMFSGGIAHDFNNLLTAILGNISLAKMYVMEKEVHNHLLEIEKASLRAKDLSHQLLAFSTGRIPTHQVTSLYEVLKDLTIFTLSSSKVKFEIFISPDLSPVEIDREQLSQAMNNLILHAYHDMSDCCTIHIQADNAKLGADNIPNLKAGDYIKISIRNQCSVIPAEHGSKTSDPYGATKPDKDNPVLSETFSIIKIHNGHITSESKHGFGTTFYIYLPALPGKDQKRERDKTLIRGHGKVLVMDDEHMVRVVTGKMLYQLGYEAEFVKNGDEAIRVYKKAKASQKGFDAVIMDLTIPGGLGGQETIQKLIDVDPQVKAIIASGYIHDPVMSEYRSYGFCGAVSKPYTIEDLGKVLQSIIEQ